MEQEIILNVFAERLSFLIDKNRTDIEFLAKTLGLNVSSIYRYKNGQMAPKITAINCLADFYNVNPTWLSGYDIPMYKVGNDNSNKNTSPLLGTVKGGYDYLSNENIIRIYFY